MFVAQECEHRVRETHFFVFDLLELAPMPVREGGGGLLARSARREALALPAAMRMIFPESARRKLHYWYGKKLALGEAYHERADLVCSNSPHEIKATTGATRTARLCMHCWGGRPTLCSLRIAGNSEKAQDSVLMVVSRTIKAFPEFSSHPFNDVKRHVVRESHTEWRDSCSSSWARRWWRPLRPFLLCRAHGHRWLFARVPRLRTRHAPPMRARAVSGSVSACKPTKGARARARPCLPRPRSSRSRAIS